jgi:membrane protein implicated in regulation of membrane protease activity
VRGTLPASEDPAGGNLSPGWRGTLLATHAGTLLATLGGGLFATRVGAVTVVGELVVGMAFLECRRAFLMEVSLGAVTLGLGLGDARTPLGLVGLACTLVGHLTALGRGRSAPTAHDHLIPPGAKHESQRGEDDEHHNNDHDDEHGGHLFLPPLVTKPAFPGLEDGKPTLSGAYDLVMTALGIVLLVLGTALIAVEAHVPRLGMLGGPGVIALAAGALLAVGGLGGGLAVALVTALLLGLAGAGLLTLTLRKGAAVRRRRVRAGAEGLVGRVGVVRRWEEPRGKVLVDGALWHARRSWGDEEGVEIHEGDHIVVERLEGLTLAVRPAEAWELVR